MKKTVLHAALFTLITPGMTFALGLGDLVVNSYLDQPFDGEIKLIDLDRISLSDIKVRLASLEDYERAGIEQSFDETLLSFAVKKNKQGPPVIKITSSERMSAPYIQLLIDLAWADGQLYREYTILLDPPGYQLVSSSVQGSKVSYTKSSAGQFSNEPGVIDKKVMSQVVNRTELADGLDKALTYGPVKNSNENVWQIAQRYKSSDVVLQQLVLAIVGANPGGFKDGNLNALQVGSKLTIPPSSEVRQIPVNLAKQEIAAHDQAWKNKSQIKHVLTPPYTDGRLANTSLINKTEPVEFAPLQPSSLMKTPEFSQSKPESKGVISSLISATSMFVPQQPASKNLAQSVIQPVKFPSDADSMLKAEISITKTAVDSAREANGELKEQFERLQAQNEKLQAQLEKSVKDISSLRQQMEVMIKERHSVASQAHAGSINEDESWPLWPWWFVLFAAFGGGAYAYWSLYLREQEEKNKTPIPPSSNEGQKEAVGPSHFSESAVDQTDAKDAPASDVNPEKIEPASTDSEVKTSSDKNNKKVNQNVEKPIQKSTKSETLVAESLEKEKVESKLKTSVEKDQSELSTAENNVDGSHELSDKKARIPKDVPNPLAKVSKKSEKLDGNLNKEHNRPLSFLNPDIDADKGEDQSDIGLLRDDVTNPPDLKTQKSDPVETELDEFNKEQPKADSEQNEEDNGLNFEPGLHKVVKEESIQNESIEDAEDADPGLDFDMSTDSTSKKARDTETSDSNESVLAPESTTEIKDDSSAVDSADPVIDLEEDIMLELDDDNELNQENELENTKETKQPEKKTKSDEVKKGAKQKTKDLSSKTSSKKAAPDSENESIEIDLDSKEGEIDLSLELEEDESGKNNKDIDVDAPEPVIEPSDLEQELDHAISSEPSSNLDLKEGEIDLSLELEEDESGNNNKDIDVDAPEPVIDPSDLEQELENAISSEPSSKKTAVKPEDELKLSADDEIDDNTDPSEKMQDDDDATELANPLKSKEALDTLLALAQTYIGMDDIESAKQSLQEVVENGDEAQKAEAKRLLDELG